MNRTHFGPGGNEDQPGRMAGNTPPPTSRQSDCICAVERKRESIHNAQPQKERTAYD